MTKDLPALIIIVAVRCGPGQGGVGRAREAPASVLLSITETEAVSQKAALVHVPYPSS